MSICLEHDMCFLFVICYNVELFYQSAFNVVHFITPCDLIYSDSNEIVKYFFKSSYTSCPATGHIMLVICPFLMLPLLRSH